MAERPIDRRVSQYFEGKITEEKLNKQIEEYLKDGIASGKFTDKIMARLDRRKDANGKKKGRTYARFFIEISEGIRKEHAIFLKWIEHMEKIGYEMKWEKYGTDAIGLAFVEVKDDRPDYLVSINNSPFFVVDAKTCPIETKNTFKTGDLRHYEKYNASMVVCMGKIGLDNQELKSFSFYGPLAIRHLLKLKSTTYPEFAPNKQAVRASYKKTMKSNRAQVSFEELLKDGTMEMVKVTEKDPEFRGPLKRIIDGHYLF
jgi:hypothetical protein